MAQAPRPRGAIGLSPDLIAAIDWPLAIRRVRNDMRTDFLWEPQNRYLLSHGDEELIRDFTAELRAGTFYPGVPLTIEVPKSFRMLVGANIRRLGPNFSRPGSVLPVKDRILYQAIADQFAVQIENATNRTRSFSHVLTEDDADQMFLANRVCWGRMQSRIRELAANDQYRYVLKLDIADYFGSINQHILINLLKDLGVDNSLAEKLEELLLTYTGQRSSRGILQGLYPSDLLGAFYMQPIDRLLDEEDVPSVRYVDDMYVFVRNVAQAGDVLRKLITEFRQYDLRINEAKSKIILKNELFSEEPDLEDLFSAAMEELQSSEEEDEEGYGFQTVWDDEDENPGADPSDDDDDEDMELAATKRLFDAIETYPGQEENIERFCLPLLSKADSDYAVEHVLSAFTDRASMTQIYCSYLGKFIRIRNDIVQFLTEQVDSSELFDWQKIWIIAALHQRREASDEAVRVVSRILQDGAKHEGLRAVAATYVGRYGDGARRRSLLNIYPRLGQYVQYAVYYSSRSWPRVERRTARQNWGTHSEQARLLTEVSN